MKYINIQLDIFTQLNKAKINYKKSPKDRITQAYIEARLESIDQKWSAFTDNHKKIIKELTREEFETSKYAKNDVQSATEEFYIEFKSELKQELFKFISQEQTNVTKVSTSKAATTTVSLPKINIPIFSGNYVEWISFRDLFVSLIHKNATLDNVQKLHYLKGYLTGEAEQLVRNIAITNDNYEQCWNQLVSRYNNKQFLVNCTLKRLFSQRNVLNESASALKELLDTTVDCLNSLKNLGIQTDTWDSIIIYMISLKLDQESRKLWELKFQVQHERSPLRKTRRQYYDPHIHLKNLFKDGRKSVNYLFNLTWPWFMPYAKSFIEDLIKLPSESYKP